MEFAKTRVQLRTQKGIPTPRNPFLVVTNVYKQEGLRALYKGCGALVVVSLIDSHTGRLFYSHLFCIHLSTGCLVLVIGLAFPSIPTHHRNSSTATKLVYPVSNPFSGLHSQRRRPLPLFRPDKTRLRRPRNRYLVPRSESTRRDDRWSRSINNRRHTNGAHQNSTNRRRSEREALSKRPARNADHLGRTRHPRPLPRLCWHDVEAGICHCL